MRSLGLDKQRKAAEAKGWVQPSAEEAERRLAALRNYRWSSYPFYAGFKRNIPAWLDVETVLGQLGGQGQKATYLCLAERAVAHGQEEAFLNQLKNRLALGRAEFVERVKLLFESIDRDQAGHRELRERHSWDEVVSAVEKICDKSWSELQNRGEWGRFLVYWGARRYAGMTLKGISEVCGMTDYGAVNMGVHRLVARADKETAIRDAMQKMDEMLNVQT